MQPTNPLLKALQAKLEQRESKGTRRSLKILPPDVVDFSSNDFLSLSTSTTFREHYLKNLNAAAASSRIASGGSRLLDGNSTYAQELETFIADFHNAPCGLLFNSGFDANAGVFACIPQPGDVIIYDELIHASVHDGMRLSRAGKRLPFKHNSVEAFQQVLESQINSDELLRSGKRNVIVAIESLYSMEGDFGPIREILDVLELLLPNGNGHLIVDEAHSTGVFGPRGAGRVQELGVEDRVFLRVHTFGKALASNGAIVLCSPVTREYLINYARPLIFTSAMGLPSLVAVRTAYELMAEGGTVHLQGQLQRKVQFLRTSLQNVVGSQDPILQISNYPTSPIFSLRTKVPRELAKVCQEEGLMARPIMSPTVPEGTERVRVCLHSRNSPEELQRLVDVIAKWLKWKRESAARL